MALGGYCWVLSVDGENSESLSTITQQFKVKRGVMSATMVDSKFCPSIK